MKRKTNHIETLINSRMSRRAWLRSTAGGAVVLPGLMSNVSQAQTGEPHFFLHVCISGGVDPTYLFDARPLIMTDKGKIQNYLYINDLTGAEVLENPQPIALVGSNGQKTLRTPIVEPLMAFQKDFSVVNGICMLTNGFVGHGNNMYYLFTNSANPGSDSFIPHVGAKTTTPLESVHIGGFEGDGNQAPPNFSGSIQLGPGQGGNLGQALANGPKLDLDSPVMKHVLDRLQGLSSGTGKFSIGSAKMLAGVRKIPSLARTLQDVTEGFDDLDPNMDAAASDFLKGLQIALGYFKGGVSNSITVMYDRDPAVDTHGGSSAQMQLSLYRDIIAALTTLFQKLKDTPYDEASGKSFFDVTTLLISSEFGRTMMQSGQEPGKTGTDHNPLTNSCILAGKGIKGGMVLGASDLDGVDEQGELANVSGAHKEKDNKLNMMMGKPFDFDSHKVRSDLPETFNIKDYLNFPSVANTVMEIFGVSAQDQFRIDGNQAPILKGLLK